MIYNIGDLSYHILDYQESIKYLTRFIEMDNKSARALEHLCMVYQDSGDYNQMLVMAKMYVKNLGDYKSYRYYSKAYIKLNDIESGIMELENHLKNYHEKRFNIFVGCDTSDPPGHIYL